MKLTLWALGCTVGLLGTMSFTQQTLASEIDAFDMSLQELIDIEVTSVARQAHTLSNSPAAIYVITHKDIQRSGALSIPQALKDVPGLHVAQIDSQKWAVSSRGFNGRFNNKLLVLMDGRTLYSPEFSGVYWEMQDTLMADIERIEIIRGPSAAMWGANAVNGVINIVTKHSADTQGGYFELGAGDYEHSFVGFRYGGKLNENTTARGYAKRFKRGSLSQNTLDLDPIVRQLMANTDNDNSWSEKRVGGRIDMTLANAATLLLSSDIHQSKMNHVFQVPELTAPYISLHQDGVDATSWNILTQYNKALSATSEYSLQAYFDYARRHENLFDFSVKTLDLEFQHQFQLGDGSNNIRWGLGYRHIRDEVHPHPSLFTDHDKTNSHLWNAFIRDEITLAKDSLWLTLATRLEHNSYTNVEWQPNVRLMWKVNAQHKLWSSVAYAVRTPSRLDKNLRANLNVIPPFVAPNTAPLPLLIQLQGRSDYD